jgi:hypothetical protein
MSQKLPPVSSQKQPLQNACTALTLTAAFLDRFEAFNSGWFIRVIETRVNENTETENLVEIEDAKAVWFRQPLEQTKEFGYA